MVSAFGDVEIRVIRNIENFAARKHVCAPVPSVMRCGIAMIHVVKIKALLGYDLGVVIGIRNINIRALQSAFIYYEAPFQPAAVVHEHRIAVSVVVRGI